MPLLKPAHYLVLDGHDRAIGHEMRLQYAEQVAAEADGFTRIVDLYWSDVATLARIAAVDFPALTRKGSGFLGAGTHVAQPYLEVMLQMHGVDRENIHTAQVGWDSCDRIVITFLSNAATWKGDTARAVKAALKALTAK